MNELQRDAILATIDVLQEIVIALSCREISADQAKQLTGQLQDAKQRLI